MSAAIPAGNCEAAILSRLIRPERADLSPEAARSILKLEFDDEDRARMHALAAKAQRGELTDAEEITKSPPPLSATLPSTTEPLGAIDVRVRRRGVNHAGNAGTG